LNPVTPRKAVHLGRLIIRLVSCHGDRQVTPTMRATNRLTDQTIAIPLAHTVAGRLHLVLFLLLLDFRALFERLNVPLQRVHLEKVLIGDCSVSLDTPLLDQSSRRVGVLVLLTKLI
jgi:hypothetical protein